MANDKLLWLVIIHLTFVVTALMLTLLDRALGRSRRGRAARVPAVTAMAQRALFV